jgi:glycosyltransferase involved in cell wall biosynthesis
MGDGGRNIVVLQVLPSLVTGGVERGTLEVTQAVAGAGWTALVASAGGPLVTAVHALGGQHLTLPADRKDPLTIWRNAARLTEVIRSQAVTIVHARSRAPAWAAWLACRRTGAHFVTTYHGVYGEDLPFKRRYNAVMAEGERVIAASRFVADLIVARHGIEPSRIRVIPRGVDPATFDPEAIAADRIARLARVWNLPDAAPIIMLPGRLTSWKGQEVLIAALPRISRHGALSVLVGADQGGRYTTRLLRQAAALGVGDRVRIVGECDDMPAALLLADVVVHASTEPEAFGRVVIEAQAMGRPVIASDLGGPVETVEHEITGWRIPPGNAAALAATIDAVLAIPAGQREEFGRRAREAVLQRYTVASMQQATLEVYRQVIALA